jgi:ABC-2 type transport system ATP-binding protein
LILLLGFFGFQIFLIGILNYPWITYYDENEVKDMKEEMLDFSNSHQNPDSGLFIEPDIDSNYRAIDSINFSSDTVRSSDLINPRNNDEIDKDLKEFFFYYLFEKQNDNGSYSDISGLGNMISTFQVVDTIDHLDGSFVNLHSSEYEPNKISSIIGYLINSLDEEGKGFKLNEYAPTADIISTYCAIHLAKRFNTISILNNENISKYVNDTLVDLSAELTYYRLLARIELEKINKLDNINSTGKAILQNYFNLILQSDGGYAALPGGESDVQSTYFSLSSLYMLNITPQNLNKTLYYILNCSKSDGGFGFKPDINNDVYLSDFKSGWAVLNAIKLIEKNISTSHVDINSYEKNYYTWLYDHQAINGLFGEISLQANYWGVLANYEADPDELEDNIDIDNIWDYVEDCYDDKKGGFAFRAGESSDVFSTYCAINIYEILYGYEEVELPDLNDTIEYLEDLQNSDGGFKIGLDLSNLLNLFGPLREIYLSLLKTNMSNVESTFWAIYSLKVLDGLGQIDNEDLMHWIRSCQNADGGFSIILGFHSDTISTYCGLQVFKLLDSEPISKTAPIEFLKKAQNDEGSFDPIPVLATLFELPTSFLITYHACKALYDYEYQPEEIEDLIDWYEDCLSSNTGGIGDYPEFGGDLRNTPYAIILLEDLRYDQDFNPRPWIDLISAIIFFEIVLLVLFGIVKVLTALNVVISKRIKGALGIEEKFNVSYLRRFPAIRCENLNIFAGGKLIVDSVSMRIEHSEILGVLGESGAGKSTFVKALLGMRKYNGISEVYGMDSKKYSKKIRPIYGYVPQSLMLYEKFTVMQNIIYFGRQYDISEKEILSRAKRLVRSLEIEDKANELVKNLSGGQKRRVSIAIALIHTPVICILDEPTSGLDSILRSRLWLTLTQINEQFDTTLIVITHYPEESRFCHKVAIFGRERGMIAFGRSRDLLAQLPGGGRKVELYFNDVQEKAVELLESIKGIEHALENKVGTDYVLFTDLELEILRDKIKQKFPRSIPQLLISDSKMEEFFRIKAIKVPEIE